MMLNVPGPPELLDRLQVLADEQGYLELSTPWGLVMVALAGDDAVMAEAGRVIPRYLAEGSDHLTTTQMWLRNAADRAYRERRARS
jgi:hypothetical protein